MSVLGLIPARGGSKSIPRKNIKLLGGKPLIQWTIESAKTAPRLDRLVVSTEDAEIASVAAGLGVETLARPPELARDDTPMAFVMRHALEAVPDATVLVLLQPTAPFRRDTLIDEAVTTLLARKVWSVVSFAPIPAHSSPDYAWFVTHAGNVVPLQTQPTVRQSAKRYFYRDGGVYAFNADVLRKGKNAYQHCVPLYVSLSEACTLDEPEDWAEAERRVASMLVTA